MRRSGTCRPGDGDDDGDQSGDETIFDGRDAGLTVDKAMKQMNHWSLHDRGQPDGRFGICQNPGARQATRTVSAQIGGDRVECGREVGADQSHGGDDDDGDQRGDETILDGRDTGLIVDKAAKQITHD